MAQTLYALSALLALVSFGLIAYTVTGGGERAEMKRRLRQVMSRTVEVKRDEAPRWEGSMARLGGFWLRRFGTDKQIVEWLGQAGWHRQQDQAIFFGVQMALPVFALALGLLFWFTQWGGRFGLAFVWLTLGTFAAGFYTPRLVLRRAAKTRLRRIRAEVQMLAHLLKVLFEAGLSLDQALLTISTEHADMLPELAGELRPVLRQVRQGADRSETLAELARTLSVPDLTDLITLLRQVDRYGGNVQQPLRDFIDLLEERQRMEIQERVGKLSGAMTVVMILFLFPALLIFLAGPGFLSIVRVLVGIGG